MWVGNPGRATPGNSPKPTWYGWRSLLQHSAGGWAHLKVLLRLYLHTWHLCTDGWTVELSKDCPPESLPVGLCSPEDLGSADFFHGSSRLPHRVSCEAQGSCVQVFLSPSSSPKHLPRSIGQGTPSGQLRLKGHILHYTSWRED